MVGIAVQNDPFVNVYKGIDKISKRALSIRELKAVKNLDLSAKKSQDFAEIWESQYNNNRR